MDITLILILTAVFVAITLMIVGLFTIISNRATALLDARQEADSRKLHDLFVQDVSPREILVYAAAGSVVVTIIVSLMAGSITVGIVLGIMVLFLPGFWLTHLKEARMLQFQDQLPSALDQMASSARAGLSLAQAIEEVGKNSHPPISQEFQLMAQDYRLGRDLAQAIDTGRKRIKNRNFDLVATTLLVNRAKGGDLPEALNTLSTSLKEIWRLEQTLITASAEGRKAIKIIAAMPIMLGAMVMSMQPNLAETLTSSIAGIGTLILAILMYVGALLWLRRLLKIEI